MHCAVQEVKKMRSKFSDVPKLFVILILRMILKVFWIVPINKNRIVFSSFMGRQYSCNPKYIFLEMYKMHGNSLEYIWCRNSYDENLAGYTSVKTLKFWSFKFIFYLLTCKVYITNLATEPFIPKRKGQLFINTWHGGGAYKSPHQFYKNNKCFEIRQKIRSKDTDYFLSSCELFTKFNAKEWYAHEQQFIPTGMPRNDILIREKDNDRLRAEIKIRLGLKPQNRILLYAPTYRGIQFAMNAPLQTGFNIDCPKILNAVEERFGGDFVFLYRCHPSMLAFERGMPGSMDVSSYPDMQELLLAADVLITDYSSSIWDYSFTKRPGFLFTPDLEQYKSGNDFFTPIDTWPYKYAESNSSLAVNIKGFNEAEHLEKIENHHKMLGSYDKGTAASETAEMIKNFLESTR